MLLVVSAVLRVLSKRDLKGCGTTPKTRATPVLSRGRPLPTPARTGGTTSWLTSCERRHPSVLSRPTHSPTRELSSSPRESCTPALGTSRPDTHPEGARTNERPVQGSALCLTLYTVCNLILIDGRASPREPPHRQEPRGPAAARGRGARAEGARCTAPLSSGEDLSHTHPPPPPRRKPYLLRLAEAS